MIDADSFSERANQHWRNWRMLSASCTRTQHIQAIQSGRTVAIGSLMSVEAVTGTVSNTKQTQENRGQVAEELETLASRRLVRYHHAVKQLAEVGLAPSVAPSHQAASDRSLISNRDGSQRSEKKLCNALQASEIRDALRYRT